MGRLGGCGAGARRSTLLVGRPKTAPALGRVDFAPGVVLGGHLALALPPPPSAQFPSFGPAVAALRRPGAPVGTPTGRSLPRHIIVEGAGLREC